jgi:hypothetical protein
VRDEAKYERMLSFGAMLPGSVICWNRACGRQSAAGKRLRILHDLPYPKGE